MKIYGDSPSFRTRQLLSDAGLAAWIGLWIWVGMRVRELVDRLAAPGRSIEDAGSDFAGVVGDLGSDVGGLPVVGDALQAPFETVAGAGRYLRDAGAAQQDAVHTLAVWLGVLLALIPISYVLYKYVPDRLRWVREATAAERLQIDSADLQLFALRAVATKPLYELNRAVRDPAAALEAGDYEALAGLELRSLGLEPKRL